MTEDELEILEEFIQESREHLSAIEPDLLEMERLGSETASDIVNRVFRAIHSIKGGAAFLAFNRLKEFSHVMESVLMLIRDKKMDVVPNVIDALLKGIDVLRKMVDDVRDSDLVDCSKERAALDALLQNAPGIALQATVHTELEIGVSIAAREAIAHGQRLYRIIVDDDDDLIGQNRTLAQFEAFCGSVGKVLLCRTDPVDQAVNAVPPRKILILATVLDQRLLSVTLGLSDARIEEMDRGKVLSATNVSSIFLALEPAKTPQHEESGAKKTASFPPKPSPFTSLRATQGENVAKSARLDANRNSDSRPNVVNASTLSNVSREAQGQSLEAPPPAPSSLASALVTVSKGGGGGGPTHKDSGTDAAETLRVRVELLNQLMDSASELVLGRNQLLRTLKEQADKSTGLGIILQHIDRVTTNLQESIMQTRMQQIGTLFSRYARVARDLGRQLGKNVELRSEGNHVELDKSIIEALVDPLTHIVRNAVDHAIETPEERRKRKKPEVGRVLLSASHESGQVKIVVEDDGRGIDRGKVLRKAIEKGIVTPAAAEKLTERDVVGLLMMPGFSTADQISDVSGRGVGMDVVRTNVESLGGQIEIESELGFGTSVQLRLPLTLAIIPSLIVGAIGGRFAVPQASIVELVWVRADDPEERVQAVQGALTLRLRERLLPLINVENVLKGRGNTENSPAYDAPLRSKDEWYILVLRSGAENYGLIVDELFESEEIVVKPLPQFLKGIDCFAGTTILGDGSVTMILDPSGIATRAGLKFASTGSTDSVASDVSRRVSASKRSVILFAGSPTEQYLVPQEKVLRLERISRDIIQQTGGRDYVCYRGVGLPLVRLETLLPVSGVPDFTNEVFLLIPRMVQGRAVDPAAGILVWRIVDAMDLELSLQAALFDGPGVKGATLVDGVLSTMLDPVELVNAAIRRKERAA